MMLLGQFINFFLKIFYTQKNPTKYPSNVYSDIPIRLKALKKASDFLPKYFYALKKDA